MGSLFDPLRVSAAAFDVLVSGHGTAEALAARQNVRLAQLLDVAATQSRFYARHLQGKWPGGIRGLSDLPTVSRAELMANFEDWVTDPQLKLDALNAFTADPRRIAEPYLGKYLIWESSGSSHQPGMFVQDGRSMAVFDALESFRRSPPRPLLCWFDPLLLAERVAFVGAITGHFASMVIMQRLRQLNPWLRQSLRSFSILQSASALVEQLNAFAPTVIATYPTAAALLADEASRGALRFAPREIWTGGETLSAAVRQRVEQVLGCSVRNSYGASEFMSIGWECAQGCMHANVDWVILEPVDERGQPVPAGLRSHSTLLTNLANHVQPLIRYDMGDSVTLHPERCACGSSLPVIEVQGRLDDALVMAGWHGQPVTLLPMALTTVLEEEASIFDFQLRQRDDHTLVLRLDLPGSVAEAALLRGRAALEKFALSQGVASLRVIAELGQAIPRGRSGKALRVMASASQCDPAARQIRAICQGKEG